MAGNDRSRRDSIWVILLAGGEGSRLRGSSIGGFHFDRPKQFCAIARGRTMLDMALDRARSLTDPSRILTVVAVTHRPWWEAPLNDLPRENLIAQPANLGNAVAVFNALFQILRRDRNPTVIVLPSDHAVDDEGGLLGAIRLAAREARRLCDRIVLLGMAPDRPEPDYGWIVADRSHEGLARPVVAFREKPSAADAAELMRAGALWNSFIFASTGVGLLRILDEARPDLLGAYPESLLGDTRDQRAIERFYRRFSPIDLSREVLARSVRRLSVLAAGPCGWTDLGSPARVGAWLEKRARAVSLVPYGRGAVCEMTRM
jgi:mannose-1-phosphate guanylyltransferase